MKKVSKSLTAHLARLTELVTRIENSNENVAQIDIDILLDELREMYNDVYRLPIETEETEEEPETEEEAIPAVAPAPEPVAVTTPEPEPEPEPEQPAATTPEMAALMVDNEAEPVFAEEPASTNATDTDNSQPTMEELEGQPNDELFEEAPVPANEEPEAEPAAVNEEQPKTLWEKLQDSHTATTIAEKIGAAKSISDLLEEKASQQKAAAETQAAEPAEPAKPVEEPVAEPPAPKETPAEPAAAQPSLFDYFKSSAQEATAPRTLADTLGEKATQAALAHNGNPRPDRVHDLRTIININDKFSFMNELFHNNMKGYNDFILHLNAIDDREEAQRYVDSIADQYNWDNESITVKTFYSIFDRKF